MNTIPKDLGGADAVLDHLRTVDVMPWCPAEVAAAPAIREFVRSLYLSGNGAVIFGNSFVQWAASEGISPCASIVPGCAIRNTKQAQAFYWSGRLRTILTR